MIGNQEPRIRIEPDRTDTEGTGATILMKKYGYALDEWQSSILDCWLGCDKSGAYTMTSGGLSVPRQNGKNVILEARELYGLVINGERILHTAHLVRTSKKSFRRLVRMFTDKRHPEIMALVDNIRYTNGEEAIELTNGGVIEFSSRSKQTARGFDGISLIVFDEAQELTDDQLEAIMATLSASTTGTRQIIYTGTPPYPSCSGTVFKRFRESTIKSETTHNAWHEWSVSCDNIDEFDITDKAEWYKCNPALGTRLSVEFTQAEAETETKDGFMRERLGWWCIPKVHEMETAIDPVQWDECKSDELKPTGKTAYGIKFSADGSLVCLSGAVISTDGIARISLIEIKPTGYGLNWLAEWLNDRVKIGCCVVIDGRNGVDVLIDKISSVWIAKNSVIRPSANDVIASASLLVNEIAEHTITWYAKQDALRDSALSVTKRGIGKGWAFGGANSLPLESCALALYGVRTSKRDPQKKMRIG